MATVISSGPVQAVLRSNKTADRGPIVPAAIAEPPDLPDGEGCLDCGAALELHQPDMRAPDRIVCVCPDCGSVAVYDEGELRLFLPGGHRDPAASAAA